LIGYDEGDNIGINLALIDHVQAVVRPKLACDACS